MTDYDPNNPYHRRILEKDNAKIKRSKKSLDGIKIKHKRSEMKRAAKKFGIPYKQWKKDKNW